MGGLHRELFCSLPDGRDLSERLCASAPSRSCFVHLTRLPTSFLRPEVQSWQPLHDMVLVVRRCRSCAAFRPGRRSLFHAYSFAARPPHRCHMNPKPYRTLINQSSQRLQRGCTASPWTRAKLSQGYDVGQLLLDKSTKCFAKGLKQATYFEHYAHLFYEMADHICPALTEANGA